MVLINVKKELLSAGGPMSLKVDIRVQTGELISLFGPSGSGKTSILRMIAGLMRPEQGRIEVNGQLWFDHSEKVDLPPRKREIGFVFQDYSLFPHMTVRQNIGFALKDKREARLVDELLDTVHLAELQHQKPVRLSGGQQQRVALARAVARRPKLLLLDEPFSALDIPMRLKLQDEILGIYKRFGITTIFVGHDLSEVFKISRRIFVIERGRVLRQGPPEEIFAEENLSGKFKFAGSIVEIRKERFLSILTVQIGNNFIRVVATEEEMQGLSVGDKIIVASKAFNPIIMKYPQ